MFLSDISIKRPIMISMLLLALLMFGAISYFGLNLDLTPDMTFPMITVQTVYPGAGPQETELQITKRIEDAISTVSGIDYIQSYSMESASFVIIRFKLSKDVDIANQEVKDKVDAILNDMPDDADRPIIQKFDINSEPIMNIVLSGNIEMTELYELADKTLTDRFSQIQGVGEVSVTGGGEREIQVEFDNRTILQQKISISQLAGMLSMQNMDMPGGNFKQHSQEYSVRLEGEFDTVEDLKQLKVPTGFGMKPLSELARVRDATEEVRVRSTFVDNVNKLTNDNVVVLGLVKAKDGNAVRIATAVKERMPELQELLPEGCELSIIKDSSILIEGSVKDTLSNIFMGVILTGLVLLFFLSDLRSTIIVALSMPMSIISTFMLLQLSGFTLNLMTLMGLSTAVGVLVSNSVVVLENIFRHKNMGNSRREASAKGTAEVVVAVIASTMTNIAVFLPIANMGSIVGMMFKEFALTVVYATIFSLLMSFTLTPMLASLIIPEHDTKKHPIGKRMNAMFTAWEDWYKRLLSWIIKNKMRSFMVILVSIFMFVGSFFMASQIGFDFMPKLDEGDIKMEVELPTGYNLNETAQVLKEMQTRIEEYSEVKTIVTTLGKINDMDTGTNMALVNVKLVDVSLRDVTTGHMAAELIQKLSDLPNVRLRIEATSSMGMGTAPVNFTLMGQDVQELEKYRREIVERIHDVPGLINLNTSSRPGKPEITIVPDREKLSNAGLTIYDLAMTLRGSLEGLVTTKFRDQGEEYDIRVSLTDESVDTPEEVESISVVAPAGTFKISQLADIKYTQGFTRILHKDKFKMIDFGASTAPGVPMGDVTNEIDSRLADLELPPGYKVEWAGMAEEMKSTIQSMLFTFVLAIVLTYMLLAAILESFTQPLLILGTVPLAMIGVFGGLYITGISMNIISMMAIIMLLGIVVNNAILLLDYTNLLVRQKGYNVHDALVEACPTKLKPILMSSIAIILGMLPMALGIGASGREFRQPMGVVSIGGLLISTVLALIVIPTLYYLTSRQKVKKQA